MTPTLWSTLIPREGATVTKTTIAAVQMRSRPKDVDHNIATAERFVGEAAAAGAKLVLLPEVFNVGYYIGPSLFDLWETEDGRTVTWMREQASLHGMMVGGTIAERRGDRLLNTFFMVEPDGRMYRYSKRQPTKTELAAYDPGADESIVETSLGRIGRAVCADIVWGRSLLRSLAGSVDLVLLPQANPEPKLLAPLIRRSERRRRTPHERLIRAIGAPMARAGLVGPVQRLSRVPLVDVYMYGGAFVADADGRLLAGVPAGAEGVAVSEAALGSTGGDPNATVFKDPGLLVDLLQALAVSFPNLRPEQPSGRTCMRQNGAQRERA